MRLGVVRSVDYALMQSKNESAGKGEPAVKKSRILKRGRTVLAKVKKSRQSGSVPALIWNCPPCVHPPNLEGSGEFLPDSGRLSEEAAGCWGQLLVGRGAVREVQHLI